MEDASTAVALELQHAALSPERLFPSPCLYPTPVVVQEFAVSTCSHEILTLLFQGHPLRITDLYIDIEITKNPVRSRILTVRESIK